MLKGLKIIKNYNLGVNLKLGINEVLRKICQSGNINEVVRLFYTQFRPEALKGKNI